MLPQSEVIFFSSRRRHTRFDCDWSSDVCSSDLHGCVNLRPSEPLRSRQREPILAFEHEGFGCRSGELSAHRTRTRSEEHTSELQSQSNLVCRLLLEKKKKNKRLSSIAFDRFMEASVSL